MLKGNNTRLKRDLAILVISVVVAYFLFQSPSFDQFIKSLTSTGSIGWSAFVIGIFFTSAFTTAPAIAALIKMAQFAPAWQVALFGAIGAVIGDAIIFYFMRDRLIKDFMLTVKKPRMQRIKHFLKSKIIRVSIALASGVLIAIPLPTDEAAFTLLGISRIKTPTFLAIAFSFNFVAIFTMSSFINSSFPF